jgi:hypothetical protein
MNYSHPISAPLRLCARLLQQSSAGAVAVIAVLSLTASGICTAQEPPPFAEGRDESAQYVVETAVTGLDEPSGLAVRLGTPRGGPFELFISERGAGRVVRWSTDASAEPAPVITGFPVEPPSTEEAGKESSVPLGLDFLSRDWLAVGTGGGSSQVRVYQLPADSAAEYEQPDHVLGPLSPSARTSTGERDFASLTHQGANFFVASQNGDERGWVLRATLDSNRLAGLEPFIPTHERMGRSHPSAIVIDPRPRHHYLLVAQRGEAGPELDSRVAWFSPTSGQLALVLNVGLSNVVGLAYSPAAELYALDDSASETHPAGVYRLDAAQVEGRESCRAVLVAEAPSPTAFVFAPDGTMFVASRGESSADAEESSAEVDGPRGKLLRVKLKAAAAPPAPTQPSPTEPSEEPPADVPPR